jgi:hypothetical protein
MSTSVAPGTLPDGEPAVLGRAAGTGRTTATGRTGGTCSTDLVAVAVVAAGAAAMRLR